ncbi:MAG TPA: energy transducer TonB [Terriglobia bacterium]|jgi:TonB family protein
MIEYREDTNFAWTPRVLSIGIHAALVGLALIPWASRIAVLPKLNETAVVLYEPFTAPDKPLVLPGRSGGGGGGGKHELTPPSRGELPRAADRQLVPPDPEPPKNPRPELIVEPTIVAPQIAELRSITLLNIGDPNGVVGPPSAGTGDNGGVGTGRNGGVGSGDGPGAGPGRNGGIGGDGNHSGGGVTGPKLIYRVEPEYSEEARKARFEGVVILEAIVRRDGGVDLIHVIRSVGLGLDQNAVDAVRKWRFRPATKNGSPVDVPVKVEVTFNIR